MNNALDEQLKDKPLRERIKLISANVVFHENEVARLNAMLDEVLLLAKRRDVKPSKTLPRKKQPVPSALRKHAQMRSKLAVDTAKTNVVNILNGKPLLVTSIVDRVPHSNDIVVKALNALKREGRAKTTETRDGLNKVRTGWLAAG